MGFCKSDVLEDCRLETRQAIRDIKESQGATRVIIVLGELDAGKTTLIDHLFDPFRKYSEQPEAGEPSLDLPWPPKPWQYRPTASSKYTFNCDIVQAIIKSQRYAFIDTPGINQDNAKLVFQQLVDLIRHIRDDNVVFEGIWWVVNNVSELSPALTEMMCAFIYSLCGPDYFPFLTIVITHWDCVRPSHMTMFEQELLDKINRLWMPFIGNESRIYHHGKFPKHHSPTSLGLNLVNFRANHKKDLIAMISSSSSNLDGILPSFVQELDNLVPVAKMRTTVASSYFEPGALNMFLRHIRADPFWLEFALPREGSSWAQRPSWLPPLQEYEPSTDLSGVTGSPSSTGFQQSSPQPRFGLSSRTQNAQMVLANKSLVLAFP